MRIIRVLCVAVCLIICLTLSSCGKNAEITEHDVDIVEEGSAFINYEVKDDNVYLYCCVIVKNTSGDEKQFYIAGDFKDDEGLLLCESELTAHNTEDNSDVFTLSGKSEKQFNIVFIGDFAGVNQKHDRLLPKMEAIIIDS